MATPKATLKALLRAVIRRLVPFVSRRPWLAAIAGRVFASMPSLRHRLRNMVSMPAPLPRSEQGLTASQAAVLSDLRAQIRIAHPGSHE